MAKNDWVLDTLDDLKSSLQKARMHFSVAELDRLSDIYLAETEMFDLTDAAQAEMDLPASGNSQLSTADT